MGMKKKLTENQKVFIAGVISGLSRAEAYFEAYHVKDLEVARRNASRLMLTNAGVKAEIDKRLDSGIEEAWEILRADATGAAEGLVELRDKAASEDSVKLRATDSVLDRLGIKAPDKVDVTGEMNLEMIWRRCLKKKEND